MSARRQALLGACVLIVACASSRSVAPWRPYKAEYAELDRVVVSAVIAYDGDVATLTEAGGVLLGFVQSPSDFEAVEWAAYYGGTHAVLVRDETATFNTGSNCVSSNALGTTYASCTAKTVTVPRKHYAVVRVPLSLVDRLPLPLRPLVPSEQLERSGCPALPAGCEYTHRSDKYGRYDALRVYVRCGQTFSKVENPHNDCGI